jgi:pimeloyl-ACP methyl ester carboxylesterase
MKKQIILSAALGVTSVLVGTFAATAKAQDTAGEGQYAEVNGINLYYEIHGTGDPLILLHGGLGGVVEFSQLLPALAESRQVIAVELQGHGHTADIDRPISFEAMADDVAALIEHLRLENADVMGYSLGGMVAIQTAIRHPEVVRKLVVVSAPFRWDAIHPEFRGGMEGITAEAAPMMLETPMYQYYSSVAPDVEQWPTLLGKLGDMFRQGYDWSADVPNISAPTLIAVGDNDMLPPTHAVEFYGLLGGGIAGGMGAPAPNAQLAILPNTNHFEILQRTELATIVNAFLDGSAAASAVAPA